MLNKYVIHVAYRGGGTGTATAATAVVVETAMTLEQVKAKYKEMCNSMTSYLSADVQVVKL